MIPYMTIYLLIKSQSAFSKGDSRVAELLDIVHNILFNEKSKINILQACYMVLF